MHFAYTGSRFHELHLSDGSKNMCPADSDRFGRWRCESLTSDLCLVCKIDYQSVLPTAKYSQRQRRKRASGMMLGADQPVVGQRNACSLTHCRCSLLRATIAAAATSKEDCRRLSCPSSSSYTCLLCPDCTRDLKIDANFLRTQFHR